MITIDSKQSPGSDTLQTIDFLSNYEEINKKDKELVSNNENNQQQGEIARKIIITTQSKKKLNEK